MTRVNLIPRQRLQRQRSRAHARIWVTLAASYALFLGIAMVVAHFGQPSENEKLTRALGSLQVDQTKGASIVNALEQELQQATEELLANRAVGGQPDWGVLLALFSEAVGEDIAFSRFSLGPERTVDTRRGSRRAEQVERDENAPIEVRLNGLGRDQQAVSSFVLTLEELPLFDSVKLVDTRREPFMSRHVTAFRIHCMIDELGASP